MPYLPAVLDIFTTPDSGHKIQTMSRYAVLNESVNKILANVMGCLMEGVVSG